MKIIVFGYYGQKNIGDDLFAHIFSNIFSSENENHDVILLSSDDDDEHIYKHVYENIDAFVFGGGDIFHEHFMNVAYKFKTDWEKTHKKKLPMYALSVGMSYPEQLNNENSNFVDMFDHIIFRNKNDYEIVAKRLGANNVTCLPDIVYVLKNHDEKKKYENNGKIAFIAAQPIIASGRNKYYNNIVKNIAHCLENIIIKYDCSVDLVAFNYNENNPKECDIVLNNNILAQISEKYKNMVNCVVINDVEKMATCIKNYKLNICMRFHAHILSHMWNVPFVSICFTNKAKQFMIENNLEKYIVNMPKNKGETWPCDFPINECLKIVDEILVSKNDATDIKVNPIDYINCIINKKMRTTPPYYISPHQIIEYQTNIMKKITNIVEKYVKNNYPDKKIESKGEEKNQETIRKIWKCFTHVDIDKDTKSRNIFSDHYDYLLTGKINSDYHHGIYEQIYDMNLYESINWILNHISLNVCDVTKIQHNFYGIVAKNGTHKPSINMKYIEQTTFSDKHRSGWNYVVCNMYKNFHDDNSLLIFDCYVDKTFHWVEDFYTDAKILPYKVNWIGFIHHTPDESFTDYNTQKMFDDKIFIESLKMCRGLFVMSHYMKKWTKSKLNKLNINVRVYYLCHPTEKAPEFTIQNFLDNPDKKIVQIGGWLRNSYAIYQMEFQTDIKIKKAMLVGKGMENYFKPNKFNFDDIYGLTTDKKNIFIKGMIEHLKKNYESVSVINCLTNDQYDVLLTENIVFLKLINASACNVIIECMIRNTPLIVNKIEPVVELLGENYPLYSDDTNAMIVTEIKIKNCHEYLKNLDKSILSIENFIMQFKIYLENIYENII